LRSFLPRVIEMFLLLVVTRKEHGGMRNKTHLQSPLFAISNFEKLAGVMFPVMPLPPLLRCVPPPPAVV
jgi:hypothetical protein